MNKKDFYAWLNITLADKPKKIRGDIVCRAKRVEKAFQNINEKFSYEKEYKKDGGKSLIGKMRLYGKPLEGTGINLPINSKNMYPLLNSVKWYFKYLGNKGVKK